MSPERLAELRTGVARCEASHQGHTGPFCEGFGCMEMRELLAAYDEMVQDRDDWQATAEVLSDPAAMRALDPSTVHNWVTVEPEPRARPGAA